MKQFIVMTVGWLMAVNSMGQQALWSADGIISPVINENRTVTFRIYAPAAEKMEVEGDFLSPMMVSTPVGETESAGKAVMTKNSNGVWEYTTPPLASELYSYTFLNDGLRITDPNNVYQVRDVASISNIFLMSGQPGDLYSVQEVPHGNVAKVWYPSLTMNMDRRMTVYTPAGYEDSERSYPVLYLLHGAGGDENAWSELGRAAQILDNLIAQGKAEPMIVVMTNGNASQQAAPGEAPNSMEKPALFVPGMMDGRFEQAFTDVVSYVESHYRTQADKAHRAIAGLSMGGFHAMHISALYPDTFDYVGLFSAAIHTDNDSPVYTKFYENLNRQFNTPPQLYWIGIGRTDFLYKDNAAFRSKLDSLNYHYEYTESDGGHIWRNWRIYLTTFVQRLFK
ncbi:esterase [uncultured Phocaeicola sp.]|uniref:esterase n=1 Tax=uncultured Phocaeicola sp. TaxID=990718 RepID=UPI002599E1E0|nr:esterase [uncultured Phocaeicola sp.]